MEITSTTPGNSVPSHIEAILTGRETAAVENSTIFWPLLDALSNPVLGTLETEKEYYEDVLQLLGDQFLTDPVTLGSFELGLSLHTAAPKIEAYYQFYNTSIVPSLNGEYYELCETWVYWRGKQICSPDDIESTLRQSGKPKKVKELPFDRVYNPSVDAETVVLYADIQTEVFKDFHSALKNLADQGLVRYILRYRPVTGFSPTRPLKAKPLFVAGYGVELMLKKTDYIVIDDREVETDHGEKPVKPKVEDTSDEETPVITPLHTSELSQLGYQAVQLITGSSSPLDTLQHLSQDFPSQASKIAAVEVDDELVRLLRENNKIIPGGENLLWINGLHMQPAKVEAFNVLSVMRRERTLISSLRGLGLTNSQAVEFLTHPKIAEKVEAGKTNRFDVRDDIEGGDVIIWLNDLEKDSRYKTWPQGIRNLLRQLYPGQLHSIRKNVHHAVFVLDLASKEDLNRLVDEVAGLIKRQIPIRFGVVALPAEGDVTSETLARIFYHLIESYGRAVAMKFGEELLQSYDPATLSTTIETLYTAIFDKTTINAGHEKIPYNELANPSSSDLVAKTRAWAGRLGIDPDEGVIFGNGRVFLKDDTWINKLGSQLHEDLLLLQKAVYSNEISEYDDILDFFFRNAPKRRNQYVFPADSSDVKFINLAGPLVENGIVYIRREIEDEEGIDTATVVWIVDDFDSTTGLDLIKAVSALQSAHPYIAIGLVHNPGPTTGPPNLSLLLYHLASNGLFEDPAGIEKFHQLLKEVNFSGQKTANEMEKILGIKAGSWRTIDNELARQFWDSGRGFAQTAGFEPGTRGIVINGRVVGPIHEGDTFGPEDFEALHSYESTERIGPAVLAAMDLDLFSQPKTHPAILAAQLTSIVSVSAVSDVPDGIFDTPVYSRRRSYEMLSSEAGVLEFGAKENPVFQIVISLDPLSEIAQKWSSIIKVLSEMSGVYVRVYLNPKTTTTELPVARFYRYVLSKSIQFDSDGSVKDPAAVFSAIPEDPLLTMGLEVPPAWVVVSKESIHDLDNIVLSKLSASSRETGLTAVYELKNILIDGHARDVTYANSPPSGVQIILGTAQNPHVVDTIVMANLGYLQLKANPGVWTLDLKDGRSKEIFKLQSVGSEGWSSRDVDSIGTDIVLTSFEGITVYPRVSRREGKETADVLEAEDPTTGFVNQAEKFVGKWKNKLMGVQKAGGSQAEINIFSVASGHLYERFIYIMIQSVLKHTKSTVKFWFIENFLSPSFKTFIPLLAEELGFDYELVTYKWPYWLRGQREKQREIWGYKILFLDVLFPLDLDKVIFVDADQIVRTDLKKLVDLDLHGAPYGYTPMCDSRAEVEGFRFWKQGFWKDWLKGLPYHISALYVVDLKRFRQIAAGDRLRGTYQALSADKNSLANLDQDLPNYAQHHIPIHSLPQEWLWCETWCSMDTLTTARTIDLCNDPLTKTPKLTRAKRIPEWTTYDKQVAELAQRLLKKNAVQKNGENGTAVDESMFVEIDSSSQKEPVNEELKIEDNKDEERIKDEL